MTGRCRERCSQMAGPCRPSPNISTDLESQNGERTQPALTEQYSVQLLPWRASREVESCAGMARGEHVAAVASAPRAKRVNCILIVMTGDFLSVEEMMGR